MDIEQKRKDHREYMRKYNATKKGAGYNRKHAHQWRKRVGRKPDNRKQRTQEYREVIVYFLINRDGLNCGICGKPIENIRELHIDHRIPVALGGKNRMENLRLAHIKCNYNAGVKIRKKLYGH